jgi:acyl-ACP thioesterase
MKHNNFIFEQTYKINSIHINFNKKLGLFGLLGILQDVAGEHALKLGFGYEDSLRKGFFWVLVRKKLRMNRWPNWNDTITIKTWTKPLAGVFAIREYEIFIQDEKIGDCSTSWMILDSENRRPKKLDDYESLFNLRMDYGLGFMADKIMLPAEIDPVKTIEVRISDLDMHNHVSNIKYSQWVLDSIPVDYHRLYMIKEYEVNFLEETFLGDKIECFSNITKLSAGCNNEVFFKGSRTNDNKTVFITRILTENFAKDQKQ